jgi:hypothetical protein
MFDDLLLWKREPRPTHHDSGAAMRSPDEGITTMTKAILKVMLATLAPMPLLLGAAGAAEGADGAAVDGTCPPTYNLVPANSDLRRQLDALTGSIDGKVCALELNPNASFDRNLIDNMVQ